MKRFEVAFEERIQALDQERDQVAVERDQLIITLRARNDEVHRTKEESLKELEELRAEHKLAVETLRADYEAQVRILKEENSGIIAAHTHEMDKVLKVETSIDE
jgi:adenylate kinase